MNRGLKIILLVLAVLLVVGVTVVFIKTKLDPPSSMPDINAFTEHVRQEASSVEMTASNEYRDSVYFLVMSELGIQLRDGYIDADTQNDLKKTFMSTYLPLFNNRCQHFFGSRWKLDDYSPLYALFQEVNESVKSIRNLSSDMSHTMTDLKTNFDFVNQVKRFVDSSNSKRYRGEDSARSTITTASGYKNRYPVNNCTKLVQRLGRIPGHIESDHLKQIKNAVSKLERYQKNYNSWDSFTSAYDKVGALIDSYYNLRSIYGSTSSVDEYASRASSARYDAYYYYK